MNQQLGPYKLNTIITGDAKVLAEAIPDESIDLIFTSPPYNVGLNYNSYDDNLPEDDFWKLQARWLSDAYRVARNGSRLYAIIGDHMLWQFKPLAESIGWKFHQILIWCKPNLVGGGRITRDWNTTAELCLLFHKGKRTPMQIGLCNVVTHNWIVEVSTQTNFNGTLKKVFPAQLPLRVAYSWLSRTPGQVIFDPFVGSGTTAQAAKMLGRNYLAFEIDPDTADLARERVAQTQPPLPLVIPEQLELLSE